MLYIKLFIEREKNIGQSAPECPFNIELMNIILTYDFSHILQLLSTGSVVDASSMDQSSDALDDIVSDQPSETSYVSQTLQLPDGTLAVIKNLSQCQCHRK